MADIENLNFEVILQDKNFRKRVEEDIRKAQDLNVKLSDALNFNKKVSIDPLKRVTAETKKMTAEMEKFNKAAGKDVTKRVKQLNTSLTQTSDIMRTISRLAGVTFGVEGVRRFLGSLVEITGEFEVQKMALTSMLQSADKADEIFNTLRQSALNSPYTFQDLTKYAKQLTAFNIDADSLVETEKMLADVAAGLGVDMGRIILAYGQVKAAGVLKGTELRQFTEAGVPLLQSLAEQIQETEGHAISLSEVFQRITKKEIPFEMVEEAFRRMTSEGGKFYNMQEVLVNTLQGKIGKLRDVWQQTLYDIGSAQDGLLKGSVDLVTLLVQNLDKIGKALGPVIVGFGAYGAALALAAMRQKMFDFGRFLRYLTLMTRRTNLATAATIAFGSAAKATAVGLGLLAAAAVGLIYALSRIESPMEKFNKELDEIHKNARETSSFDAEIGRLESLRKTLGSATNSYEERKRALDEIKHIVPGYHAQLTEEGRLINNNKEALDGYIESMNREARMAGAKDELVELYKKRREVAKQVADAWKETGNQPAAVGVGLFGATVYSNGQTDATAKVDKTNAQLHVASQNLAEIDRRIADINKEISADGGFFTTNDPDPTWTPLGDDKGQGIQKQIDALKEVQGYYETLKEFMSDEDIKTFFDSMGIKTNGFDFWTQILDLAKELEKVNPDAAARVFAEYNKFLVGNKVSDLKGKADAAQKWAETLRKWTKDWGGGDYHGIEGDIDKVIRDYNNEDEEITQDYIDSLNEIMEAHWGDADAINAEIAALDKLVAARRAANATEKQEKLIGLAKSIYGKQTGGLNLSEWAHKSGREIKEIISALGNVRVPKEIADMLDEKTLNALSDALEELASEDIEKALSKLNDNRLRNLQKAASVVSDIAGAMKEYAEASGNDTLASMADALSFIADTAGNVFNRLAQGDYAGAVLAVVGGIAKEIMAAATAAGIGAGVPATILKGALIPSYGYLAEGNELVYRAGADYVTTTSTKAYGIEAVAKTEIESVKYVQGFDGTCGYFGVSFVGDDYLGDGTQIDVNQNYYYDYKFSDMILVNGETGKVGYYGLFNLGEAGKGYYAFQIFAAEEDLVSITIPAGTRFPTRAMTDLYDINGNPVYIMYEVEKEITLYKTEDGFG
ncbi:MAG: tape measure protein, partial [Kiritimatiellae bacterium]|nr:tape measure protein [Kiritimatiellia bacterium]